MEQLTVLKQIRSTCNTSMVSLIVPGMTALGTLNKLCV